MDHTAASYPIAWTVKKPMWWSCRSIQAEELVGTIIIILSECAIELSSLTLCNFGPMDSFTQLWKLVNLRSFQCLAVIHQWDVPAKGNIIRTLAWTWGLVSSWCIGLLFFFFSNKCYVQCPRRYGTRTCSLYAHSVIFLNSQRFQLICCPYLFSQLIHVNNIQSWMPDCISGPN